MSAQDNFEKAREATKTLQTVYNYINEMLDECTDHTAHTSQSRDSTQNAVEVLATWEQKLAETEAAEEDVEQIRDTRRELTVFLQKPGAADLDYLSHNMKDLYYTMFAHTTVLYAKKEEASTLERKDDRTFQ